MTALVSSYVFSPLSGLWSSFERYTLIMGYNRAADELRRQGYHKESQACMDEVKKLKS
jgi:hypothetical protein|tara:strand:+ start:293 stop:466 length:174 start_codon:yes stop_codon:yes gene_type:complete